MMTAAMTAAIKGEARKRGFFGRASVRLSWEERGVCAWDWESHDGAFSRGGRLFFWEGAVYDRDALPPEAAHVVAAHEAALKARVAAFCVAANAGKSLAAALAAAGEE